MGKNNLEINSTIRIRQFQQNDSKAVQKLFKEGFSIYTHLVWNRNEYIDEVLAKDIGDVQKWYIDKKGGNFYVAEYVADNQMEESKVIGCVGVIPLTGVITVNNCVGRSSGKVVKEDDKAVSKAFELKRMLVHPSFHGKGVAQMLLKKAEHFVFSEQFGNTVKLSTALDMPRACRFYDKMGYTLTRSESIRVRDIYLSVLTDPVIVLQFYEKKKYRQNIR